MKTFQFIEKYFWAFLLLGIVSGLTIPVFNNLLMSLLKPLLILLLFIVFLKTDVVIVFKKMKKIKLMVFLILMNMIVIPLLFFYIINLFSLPLAVGILLLTAMPAAIASPALTDIVKGNAELSAGIVIITSFIAPITVPLLFWIANIENFSVNLLFLFKDLLEIIILPMLISQFVKHYFPLIIKKGRHFFSGLNIIILSVMVYAVMGSQREIILNNPTKIIGEIVLLYIVFIILHFLGYFLGFKQSNKDKIAISVSTAYMNNGMAIVLAALYFEPSILILMILSDFPWNTLLGPFKRVLKWHNAKYNISVINETFISKDIKT